MTTYEKAPSAIEALVQRSMEQFHETLQKEGVTICTLIARRESRQDGAVAALKRSGYPVYASMQITSLADRARGIQDAKLVLDSFSWDRLSDRRKVALIDQQLHRLALVRIKPTKRNAFQEGFRRDDLNRPCLKMRPYDWEIVGFKESTERHKDASVEAEQFADFRAHYAQLPLFGPDSVLQITAEAIHKAGKSKARRKKK